MNELLAKDLAAISRIDAVQNILEVVCRTTGLRFAAIARVTEAHWMACAVRDEIEFGLLPGGQLDIETTLCHEIRQHGQIIAIDHVSEDQKYCDHNTPRQYGFESYISVPIRMPDGQMFGTLCALDPKPNAVNKAETISMFRLFADLIAQHLEAQRRVDISEAALDRERETAQFREQFMAVLGHDLRNPLAAIRTGADVLAMLAEGTEEKEVVSIIQRSSVRMTDLIDNVLDFARGRLGGGISVKHVANADLTVALRQVVNELQTAWPGRQLAYDITLDQPICCDPPRIGQMVSNLVANALTHGDPHRPVKVVASIDEDGLEVAVVNHGKAIPPEVVGQLFEPFVRGTARTGQQGLGLGLYIASEIARAHRGTLTAASTDEQTRFAFRMPIVARSALTAHRDSGLRAGDEAASL